MKCVKILELIQYSTGSFMGSQLIFSNSSNPIHLICSISNFDFDVLFKVIESRYIALFVARGYIKKLFSIVCVNIYLFSIFFQWILPDGKVQDYSTLLMSWFINFKLRYQTEHAKSTWGCIRAFQSSMPSGWDKKLFSFVNYFQSHRLPGEIFNQGASKIGHCVILLNVCFTISITETTDFR